MQKYKNYIRINLKYSYLTTGKTYCERKKYTSLVINEKHAIFATAYLNKYIRRGSSVG